MKKVILGIALGVSSIAQAGVENNLKQTQIWTVKNIVSSIDQYGSQLTFVTDFSQCTSELPSGNVKVMVKPNAVMVIGGKNVIKITASDKHFTMNDPSMPGVASIGYSKYDIYPDESVSIKITLMRAADYSVVKEYQYSCKLNKGFKVYGSIYF